MGAQVYVGGVPLDSVAGVSDLVDSTIYRLDGYSGDYQATCSFAASPRFNAPWFRRGSTFQVVEHGAVTWGGLTSEPQAGDSAWSITAYGLGSSLAERTAIATGSTNADLDTLISQGLPIIRYSNSISGGSLGQGEVIDMGALLSRGGHWWVDSFGEISNPDEPEDAMWMMTPGSGYMGTADDEFITHLYGYYVSSLDVNGQPDGWAFEGVADDEAAEQFGRRERVIDMTSLGLLSGATVSTFITDRFALVGARMGFTNSLSLTETNLCRLGWGGGSPMDVRAGQILVIPDIFDARSTPSIGSSVRLTLGEVQRNHAEQRAQVKPTGFIPRDFAGALTAALPEPKAVARV